MRPTLCFVALAIASGCATVHDPEPTAATVPAAVDRALRGAAGPAVLGPIEREGDRYEAEWDDADGRHEVEVAVDGRVIEREDELPAAKVPAAVTVALAAAVADAREVRWWKHSFGATAAVLYEAKLTVSGQRRELLFTAAGARATEPNDDDEADDD